MIIGPNGVGKTRLGVNVSQASNAHRVAALRNVEIPDIPQQRFSEASQQVRSALDQLISQSWRQSFELQNLLSEILAEDREKAVAFRDHSLGGTGGPPDKRLTDTRLIKIVRLWNRHFPNRTITIDYEPMVERTVGAEKFRHPIAQMSEGERTALYLAARVVSCTKDVMLVANQSHIFIRC